MRCRRVLFTRQDGHPVRIDWPRPLSMPTVASTVAPTVLEERRWSPAVGGPEIGDLQRRGRVHGEQVE